MIEQHKSLSEKFIKKGFWLYLFSFIIAPIGYIIKIIISGEISVSEVWILYGIISLITFLSAYNDIWMTESLKHFIPQFVTEKRYDKVKSILFYAFFSQIFTSLIIACFFFFWADFIANNYFKNDAAKDVLKVFAFFFIWINIFQTISNFFMAVQNTFYVKIIDFIRMSFVMFSVLFVFFFDTSNLLHYSYSWLIWLYIWTFFSLFALYKKYYFKYLSSEKIILKKKFILQIFTYASAVFIWSSAKSILSQLDMQMIIYLLGTTEAWYYTNYLSIIGIPFMLIWPIFAFLFPVFSEMHSRWEHKKIKIIKSSFQSVFLAIWIMFNIFFFIFSEIIAYTLFWDTFIQSWVILKYSILLLVFNFLLQINFNIMAWVWKVKERIKIIFIALIFNFIMNLLLIKLIWTNWAALATWLWWGLIWILSEISLWKKYFVSPDISFLLKNIFFISILWFWFYNIFYDFFYWIGRKESFLLLFWLFILWFWFFSAINYNKFKIFIWEIKKLQRK